MLGLFGDEAKGSSGAMDFEMFVEVAFDEFGEDRASEFGVGAAEADGDDITAVWGGDLGASEDTLDGEGFGVWADGFRG